MFVGTRPEPVGPRLGMAISASAGTAVERNRIRRRIRAAFAHCPVGRDRDVVVRADRTAGTVTFHELVAALQTALDEAGAS